MVRHLVSCGVAFTLLVGLCSLAVAADAEPIKVELQTFKFKAPDDQASLFGYDDVEQRLFYYTGGAAEATVKLPADGEYEIVIKAACQPALNERAKFKVTLGGEPVGRETLCTADEPTDYKFTAKAIAGERKLAIEYTNDVYKENEYDRNFYVHGVTVKKVK
jgi:hypothetical protein